MSVFFWSLFWLPSFPGLQSFYFEGPHGLDRGVMLLFQWVVFLGAALGVKRMSHFGVDLLVEKLPQNTRRRLEMIIPFP